MEEGDPALGWLIVFAWFCFLLWLLWMFADQYFTSLDGLKELRAEFGADPIGNTCITVMVLGILVFLYWILAGGSAIGIDHIRIKGWPIGPIAFGVAGAAMLAHERLRKK